MIRRILSKIWNSEPVGHACRRFTDYLVEYEFRTRRERGVCELCGNHAAGGYCKFGPVPAGEERDVSDSDDLITLEAHEACCDENVRQHCAEIQRLRLIVERAISCLKTLTPTIAEELAEELGPPWKHCVSDDPVDVLDNWYAKNDQGWSGVDDIDAELGREEDLINDGYGNTWVNWCHSCGAATMQVVRPGKVQCGECG